MEYRRLSRTGLMVSESRLGSMTFGRKLDEEQVARLSEASLYARSAAPRLAPRITSGWVESRGRSVREENVIHASS